VKTNKYEINEISYLKGRTFKKGTNPSYEFGGKYYVIKVNELIPAGTKLLIDAKGLITSDYQNYLEQEWLKELTIKYPDAIFILNIRNIKEWILSRVNHGIIYKEYVVQI
jgi:hypothetical protein